MKILIEKRNELEAKQKELKRLFDEAKTADGYDFLKVKDMEGDQMARVESVRALNAEIDALAEEVEKLADIERIEEAQKERDTKAAIPHPAPKEKKDAAQTFGEMLTSHKQWSEFKAGQATIELPDMDVKTLFQTSAGWAPESIRIGKLVEDAQRPIQVIDVIPPGTTGMASVVYMEETTFTNAAAETAEGGTYAEAALALTERTEPVRKIAVFLPVTDEQLEDVAAARSYVDGRLRFMLQQRLDGQILTGNGTAPNLEGILNRTGIQTQAKGTDSVPDAVYKAMTLVRVTGRANPDTVVIHPNDWQGIRLLTTADGIYIWGSPSEAGPERIWGVRVVQTDAETENTALVGDFATHSQLYTRRGVEVKVTDSHSTYFIEGKQAIRADFRVALAVYRAAAFCTVTGI